ncbi:hypothetical protein EYD10_01385 [Varanus komodoensis]|nr:hypothetical protein EYD10_01385 [Varanus komodoensis]
MKLPPRLIVNLATIPQYQPGHYFIGREQWAREKADEECSFQRSEKKLPLDWPRNKEMLERSSALGSYVGRSQGDIRCILGTKLAQENQKLKKGNAKQYRNHRTIALISHVSKVMLKVLPCMEREMPDVQTEFKKGRGTRDHIANLCWLLKRTKEFQRKISLCFIDYSKAFDCVDHKKLWRVLKEMGVPQHLIVLNMES